MTPTIRAAWSIYDENVPEVYFASVYRQPTKKEASWLFAGKWSKLFVFILPIMFSMIKYDRRPSKSFSVKSFIGLIGFVHSEIDFLSFPLLAHFHKDGADESEQRILIWEERCDSCSSFNFFRLVLNINLLK